MQHRTVRPPALSELTPRHSRRRHNYQEMPRAGDNHTHGLALHAIAASSGHLRGPASHAPTTAASLALEGASHKEDDDDMLLRVASISKDLLAEGLTSS